MSGFTEAGFKEFSRTEGIAKIEVKDESEEMPYKSVNYINRDGTIGYAQVESEGVTDVMFISNTQGGVVITLPTDDAGRLPFPIEGYHAVQGMKTGATVEEFYEDHVSAFDGQEPMADETWIKKETEGLAQRSMVLLVKMMEAFMQLMGGAMGDIMQGMGEAMGAAFGEEVDGEGLKKAVTDGFDEMTEEMMSGSAECKEVASVSEECECTDCDCKCPACGARLGPDDKECSGCGKGLD